MNMNKTTKNIGAFEQKLQQMEAGVEKILPQGSTLVVERSPQTAARLAARLKGYLQLFADLRAQKERKRSNSQERFTRRCLRPTNVLCGPQDEPGGLLRPG